LVIDDHLEDLNSKVILIFVFRHINLPKEFLGKFFEYVVLIKQRNSIILVEEILVYLKNCYMYNISRETIFESTSELLNKNGMFAN
jgi:hypothetical protein